MLLIDIYNAHNQRPAKLLNHATVQQMISAVSPSNYGLGPRIELLNDHIVIRHGGANNSYRSNFRFNLSNGNGYVVFTNSTDGDDLIRALTPQLTKFLISDAL